MKLRQHKYSESEELSEFDMWVTPSLGDIKDIIEFQNVVNELEDGFRSLTMYTSNFANIDGCSAYHITEQIIMNISSISNIEVHLTNVFNAILLATGKTDNNLKCQYPIILNRDFGEGGIATVKNKKLCQIKIPRDFNMQKVIKHFSALSKYPNMLSPLLNSYLSLLISDSDYKAQLYSLGKSYLILTKEGQARNLLSSLAIFQSRGSLTAKIGHLPEKILREYMLDWGMRADFDFNLDDIDVYDLIGQKKGKNEKSRKYDFVVPYISKSEGRKLFVQCQYYAGDSGSVSHKVVDQTDASRLQTKKKFPQAVFIEYLDGAGYYSTLNGDLRKMLEKKSTEDFIQIRTAPLKFRRQLQTIDFITPLEIEHIILMGYNSEQEIISQLQEQGYEYNEILRSIDSCKDCGIIKYNSGKFAVKKDRIDIVLKYSLLDCIANFGHIVNREKEKGVLCVPGYANQWGMNQSTLFDVFKREFPLVKISTKDLLLNIQWLIDKEFVILK